MGGCGFTGFLGAFGFTAFILFWIVYPLLRPGDDKSGLGSFVFVLSTVAMFAACLLLAGLLRRQETAMTRLHEERDELRLLIRDRTPDEKTVLTEQDLAEDIERQ